METTKGESVDDIKKDLTRVFDSEVALRKDALATSPLWEVAQEWLAKSGFKVTEEDSIITLTKKTGSLTASVKFSTIVEEEPEDADKEEEYEDDNVVEAEENVEEGEAEEHEDDAPKEVGVDVHIQVADKSGKPKGEFVIRGFAGVDNRLYAESVEIDGAAPLDWYALQDDTQDRLYDLLDAVGVDDQLSLFVKQRVLIAEIDGEVSALESLKKLLSN